MTVTVTATMAKRFCLPSSGRRHGVPEERDLAEERLPRQEAVQVVVRQAQSLSEGAQQELRLRRLGPQRSVQRPLGKGFGKKLQESRGEGFFCAWADKIGTQPIA